MTIRMRVLRYKLQYCGWLIQTMRAKDFEPWDHISSQHLSITTGISGLNFFEILKISSSAVMKIPDASGITDGHPFRFPRFDVKRTPNKQNYLIQF